MLGGHAPGAWHEGSGQGQHGELFWQNQGGDDGMQVMRCRHKADCEQHKRCRCEDPSKCECLDECGCSEYASPSLTWSKVGVVLHLQWRGEDGTLFTIDCDLNCPTWPTHTRFDGQIISAQGYLKTEQPVGWLEEYTK